MADVRVALLLLRVVMRFRLHLLIPTERVTPMGLRGLLRVLNVCTPTPKTPDGERLCSALIALGPVYIKLGQLLSTRKDLLPPAITGALSTLQDNVPPIPDFDVNAYVRARANDRQQPQITIEAKPLASASIAQVHKASLEDGTEVVVKVVRPGIRATIVRDMNFLRRCGGWVDQHIAGAQRFHVPRILKDHERVLLDELNMYHEARNQIQLRRNFAESDLLYVPRVYPQWTHEDLLVMEYVEGVPIGNIAELESRGVDFKVLAHKGVATFFTQVFEHNFFHADMHPGNILIDTRDPTNPRYIALDCAIIGSLEETDQQYLAENLVAFFNRDYGRVTKLHLSSGWVPADTDPAEFERVIREVCDPIFNKPLAEISFAEFVVKLFHTAGQFNMEIQPQLALLQKTLLYVEGLGRQLYPQLDLWETAQPFIERWVKERNHPLRAFTAWMQDPDRVAQLFTLPATVETQQQSIQNINALLAHQGRALSQIDAHLVREQRYRRIKRVAGTVLLGLGLYLLWPTFWPALGTELAATNTDDASRLISLASIIVGSALIMRA